VNISVQTRTTAVGYLAGHVFQGDFQALLAYQGVPLQIGLKGLFRAHLA
jgi:hypothetical protein